MQTVTRASDAQTFSERSFWKRFRKKLLPHFPAISLDPDGSILEMTRAARRLLDYPPDASVDPCFFAHVHGRNLGRVMRDLAHMVRSGKTTATWLVRMQTSTGRWRWFRVNVLSHLDADDPRILLRLHKV